MTNINFIFFYQVKMTGNLKLLILEKISCLNQILVFEKSFM